MIDYYNTIAPSITIESHFFGETTGQRGETTIYYQLDHYKLKINVEITR